jgi:hypothetical protein
MEMGKNGQQIADHFGVSKMAISKHIRKLQFSKAKDVHLRVAQNLNDKSINVIHAITKNLDGLNREIEVTLEGLLGECNTEERLKIQESHRAYAAEIRNQLKLVKEVGEMMYNWQQVDRFKSILLEEIKYESPECAKRIIERIRGIGSNSGLPDNCR